MNKKKFNIIKTVSFIAFIAFMLVGCGAKPAEEVTTEKACVIALPWKDHANWTMTTEHEAAIAEVEALGCTALSTVGNGDVQALIANVENAITQNVDGIIIGNVNWSDIKGTIDSAIAAGIPVVSIDLGADTTIADVTSDNGQIGQLMAQALVDAIGTKGTAAVIYAPGYTPVDIRMTGFYDEMASYPNITLLGPYPSVYPNDVPDSKTQIETVLQQYAAGTLNAVVASYDAQGLGASQAITEANRKEVKVIAADGDLEALNSILAGGPFVFTVAQDMATMGKKAADILIGKIRGETVETGVIYAPALAVDTSNAAQIKQERYGQ